MTAAVTGAALKEAARILRAGGLVAFPTETVYGLGADAFNPRALARVFEVKKRPRFDPLIVHIARADALCAVARVQDLPEARAHLVPLLARAFWPGPLTLVLPRHERLPGLVSSGLSTVAVRVPAREAALELIRLGPGAIAAPSANPFGAVSPTRAAHVEAAFGQSVDLILDGGPCGVGIESTVLDLTSPTPRILRHGGVSKEALESVTGAAVEEGGGESGAASPGLLKSHYAPRTSLTAHSPAAMRDLPVSPGAAYLFFSAASRDCFFQRHGLKKEEQPAERFFTLSEEADSARAAAALFETLHRIDALGCAVIHAEYAPGAGLGRAINERLFKAGGSAPS